MERLARLKSLDAWIWKIIVCKLLQPPQVPSATLWWCRSAEMVEFRCSFDLFSERYYEGRFLGQGQSGQSFGGH
jgi:hypothetical protein